MYKRATLLAAKTTLLALSALASCCALEVTLRWIQPKVGTFADISHDPGSVLPARVDTQDVGPLRFKDLVQATPQSDLVYRLRANLSGTFQGSTVRTNRAGFRDKDIPVSKPAGHLRIVALGDSVLFGWAVEQEQSYSSLLEQPLSAACGTPVEVVNTGVPGYNTVQQVALFKSIGQHFDPDLVLIQVLHNDLRLPHFLLPPRSWHPRDWVLVDSIRRVGGRGSEQRLTHNLKQLNRTTRRKTHGRFAHLAGAEPFVAALEELAALTSQSNVPVVMLVDAEEGEPWYLASSTARRLGFDVINSSPNLIEALRERGARPDIAGFEQHIWISKQDHHPTPLGHAIVAEAALEPTRARLCPPS